MEPAVLLVFVLIEFNGYMEEEILVCEPLLTRTTGEKIFKCDDIFIKENYIHLSKCVGLTIDGSHAMCDIYSGLVTKVQTVAPISAINSLQSSLGGSYSERFELVLSTF